MSFLAKRYSLSLIGVLILSCGKASKPSFLGSADKGAAAASSEATEAEKNSQTLETEGSESQTVVTPEDPPELIEQKINLANTTYIPKVDILLAIDNSQSLAGEIDKVTASIIKLVEALPSADIRIGLRGVNHVYGLFAKTPSLNDATKLSVLPEAPSSLTSILPLLNNFYYNTLNFGISDSSDLLYQPDVIWNPKTADGLTKIHSGIESIKTHIASGVVNENAYCAALLGYQTVKKDGGDDGSAFRKDAEYFIAIAVSDETVTQAYSCKSFIQPYPFTWVCHRQNGTRTVLDENGNPVTEPLYEYQTVYNEADKNNLVNATPPWTCVENLNPNYYPGSFNLELETDANKDTNPKTYSYQINTFKDSYTPDRKFIFNAIVLTGLAGCQPATSSTQVVGQEYMDVATRTGGTVGCLKDADYNATMSNIAKTVQTPIASYKLDSTSPIVKVVFNDQELKVDEDYLVENGQITFKHLSPTEATSGVVSVFFEK